MLSDADRLLIAAHADGTVTAASERLLLGSPAARAVLAGIVDDRRRLADLPRLDAPPGFADRVEAALPIIRPAAGPPARRLPVWVPYAVAAGLLVAVGAAALQVADRPNRPGPAVVGLPPAPRPAPSLKSAPPEAAPAPRPLVQSVVVADARPEAAPVPRPAPGPPLAAAGLLSEVPLPAEVAVRVPLFGPLADLGTAEAVARAEAELVTLAPARLDLFVPDLPGAVAALQAAGQGGGLTVTAEEAARERLKAKPPGPVALYTEAVNPADVARLLGDLARRNVIGQAHLSAAGPADVRDCRELFGEPRRPARDKPDGPTIGQVLRQVGKPAVGVRRAVLVAWPPASRPSGVSKEVRAFVDGRPERKSTSLSLLVVVRSADAADPK